MTNSLTDTAVEVAIAALDSETATPIEKIEMLLEMATRLQHRPANETPLIQAVMLYNHALDLCGEAYPRLKARALAGKATALRSLPEEGPTRLLEAKALYEAALPLLTQQGSPEEKAETQMNLGLVLQSLAPYHQAQLADCIRLYQQSLAVFTGKTHPQEYAILQNNIAIAYLSIASSSGWDDLKQAIAVQTFERALTFISLIDHPSEYAMLQNNLGNALQYLPSTHPVDNNLRALAAYDQALKVRTAEDTPLAYAHTLANRANVLVNLPDDLEQAEQGNQRHVQQAKAHYREAEQIFAAYGQFSQADTVRQAGEALSQPVSEAVS
ncbi:MAG: hypothetical protein MJA27_20505 [Pseudanabaenales cyanobacterium]|nr:hypothetical protein [Pseudanabaenales cyanobacterium]